MRGNFIEGSLTVLRYIVQRFGGIEQKIGRNRYMKKCTVKKLFLKQSKIPCTLQDVSRAQWVELVEFGRTEFQIF